MSYNCEIVIAIAGMPEKIKQYINLVSILPSKDKEQLISLFKLIEFNKYCSVYIFHQQYFSWQESEEAAWKTLREQAKSAGLSYVFYRLGSNFDDDVIEEAGNNEGFLAFLRQSIALHRHIVINDDIASNYN